MSLTNITVQQDFSSISDVNKHSGLTLEIDVDAENFYDVVQKTYTEHTSEHGTPRKGSQHDLS